jgi:tetratricopeptide (TPR) repeat protein
MARCRWHLGRVAVDLGETALARRRYLEAISIQEALVRDFPRQTGHVIALATSCSTLGRLLLNGGDPAGAKARYEQAIRVCDSAFGRDPRNPVVANELAMLLTMSPVAELRDPRRAVVLAARAVDRAPRSGTYRGTLGLAHYRAGDWKAAIVALDRAAELNGGGRAFDWFLLAMAHARCGDQEQARRCYQRATDAMARARPRDAVLDAIQVEARSLLGISNRPDHR